MATLEDYLGRSTIHVGDCIEVMRAMPPDSVDCVVTSPPYWGLRDYDVPGQIGLESTLGEHLDVMVAVFEEVRRVLKPTGTLWLNYGDCYATTPNGRSAAETKDAGVDDRTFRDKPLSTVGGVLKPKDLCMIPNRLAIALQEAGWWVRSEIIWGKSNAMPDSSGTQRPSTAHEKIFLLTKSADADVWRARDTGELSFEPDLAESCPLVTDRNRTGPRWLRIGSYYDALSVMQGRTSDENAPTFRGGSYTNGQAGPRNVKGNVRVSGWAVEGEHSAKAWNKQDGHGDRHAGFNERWRSRAVTPRHEGHVNHTGLNELGRGGRRLLRNYEPAPLIAWDIAAKPFPGPHFATFPAELAAICIIAGSPRGGLVLDPFGGAGTTALVALRLDRRAALIELKQEYADMAQDRILADWNQPIREVAENQPIGGLFT